MRFGTENVPVRDAWPHEAQDPPWLAQNLGLLSNVVSELEKVRSG